MFNNFRFNITTKLSLEIFTPDPRHQLVVATKYSVVVGLVLQKRRDLLEGKTPHSKQAEEEKNSSQQNDKLRASTEKKVTTTTA